MFLIDEGDKVLGVAPQFSRFISEVELQKGRYLYYSLCEEKNYKFSVDEFVELIKDDIKMIYIDNPNNPTGQIIDIKDIEKICEQAKKDDTYVLIDEAYGDYMAENNSAINLINKFSNLMVIKSASKVYGIPNERVGYIVANNEIIEIYNKILVPFPFLKMSMEKFIKALNNRKRIRRKIEGIKKYKKYILKNVSNCMYTSYETPIFTIKTEKNIDLQRELLKNNILSESCKCFEGLNMQYVRIRIPKKYKRAKKAIIKIL